MLKKGPISFSGVFFYLFNIPVSYFNDGKYETSILRIFIRQYHKQRIGKA